MTQRIVGVVAAHEISLTRKGANPLATKVILKSFESAPNPPKPPETDMDVNVMKALLGASEIEKAYASDLEGDAFGKFFALPAAERTALAQKAADDKKTQADAKAAKLKAGDADMETMKSALVTLQETNKSLLDRLNAQDAEREIEKTAADADFQGYPGGTEAVITVIKAAKAAGGDHEKTILDQAKAVAKTARLTSNTLGFGSIAEVAKTHPATAQIEQKVQEVMSTKGVMKHVALAQVVADPANAVLVEKSYQEQGIAA